MHCLEVVHMSVMAGGKVSCPQNTEELHILEGKLSMGKQISVPFKNNHLKAPLPPKLLLHQEKIISNRNFSLT